MHCDHINFLFSVLFISKLYGNAHVHICQLQEEHRFASYLVGIFWDFLFALVIIASIQRVTDSRILLSQIVFHKTCKSSSPEHSDNSSCVTFLVSVKDLGTEMIQLCHNFTSHLY